MLVTEDQRRECIVLAARGCENALYRADAVMRIGTVRQRFEGEALHRQEARLYSSIAFTWATAEVQA